MSPGIPGAVPAGPGAGAEVWFVDLDAFGTRPGLAGLLDGRETERLRRIAEPRAARRYAAAHAAFRLVTAAYCGVPADRVRWSSTGHGKPVLDLSGPSGPLDLPGGPPQVSLSHCGGRAAVALAPGARPVGVDLERVRPAPPRPPTRVPERFRQWSASGCPEGFHRGWTRMEACVKAVGGRLADGLDLPVAGADPQGPVHADRGPLSGERWYVRNLAVPPGWAAAVAMAGAERFTVRTHGWDGRTPGPG